MVKHFVLNVTKVAAGIAGVVFWLMPLRTGTQVILCFGSFAIMLICAVVASHLNDENTGYWPNKPNH